MGRRRLDEWLSPSEFLPDRTGSLPRGRDCEDFALLKYALLEQEGVSPENMKIVILRSKDPANPIHAALLVDDPQTKQRYLLDNRNVERHREFPKYDPEDTPLAYISESHICEF